MCWWAIGTCIGGLQLHVLLGYKFMYWWNMGAYIVGL